MKLNLAVKAALGALALSVTGMASANTSLGISNGDLFLNVVDTTTNTSFLFDTGVSQSSFNGSGSYSFSLSSDANYQSFVAAEASSGDSLEYSVLSAAQGSTTGVGTILSTSSATPGTAAGANVAKAFSLVNAYLGAVNGTSSTTTTTAFTGSTFAAGVYTSNNPASNWNSTASPNNSGQYNTYMGLTNLGAVGTALSFFSTTDTTGNYRSGSANISSSAFAGTWDLVNGVLTYSSGSSSVPLPPSVLLMLSGLGMLAIIGRRKGARDLTIHGMVA